MRGQESWNVQDGAGSTGYAKDGLSVHVSPMGTDTF